MLIFMVMANEQYFSYRISIREQVIFFFQGDDNEDDDSNNDDDVRFVLDQQAKLDCIDIAEILLTCHHHKNQHLSYFNPDIITECRW
jgi:hypothetical protein